MQPNWKYIRTYRFIFNRKFLEVKNQSTYPPSEKDPDGEVHEDIGYIGYDTMRRCFVLRRFHVEGFVTNIVRTGHAHLAGVKFPPNRPADLSPAV